MFCVACLLARSLVRLVSVSISVSVSVSVFKYPIVMRVGKQKRHHSHRGVSPLHSHLFFCVQTP